MITDEDIIQEFITIFTKLYPSIGPILHQCHVRIIHSSWGNPPKDLQYISIYCSENLVSIVQEHLDALRDIAQNIGLSEVVCINASRLVRDPLSKIRWSSPRLWLELHWLISKNRL
ncbi:MAG: hypothetical protein SFW36_13945 [Leptolyngbyaceae cyanobacterium bins.59]|nr:hypothetical protein [Leptolyngbyaceae cyanobacterium bins.59]